MSTEYSPGQLATHQLRAALDWLEQDAANGGIQTFMIRALADAATLLREETVADRAAQLLRQIPDDAFWAGGLTNIEMPAKVPEQCRQLESLAELESRFPIYSRETIVRRIRSHRASDDHVRLCLEGRVQEGRERAGAGLELQEVGGTLAVLGEFEAALSVARDPSLEEFRRKGVLFVVVLELFRRGRLEEVQALDAELDLENLNPFWRIHWALAIAGREPWPDYPYPDW